MLNMEVAPVHESFCRRRRRSQTLKPLIMPAPAEITFPADYDDVVEEGKSLFNEFLMHRFEEEDVEKEILETPETVLPTTTDCKNPMWARAGRELRLMADEFARSGRRGEVREKAERVNVNNITYEQFKDLLSTLFSEGHVTTERIMVLFYFCSDVALRCLTSGVDLCRRFLTWSLCFITQNVCRWVRDSGGWDDVLVIDRIPPVPKPIIVFGIFCFVTYFAVKYYRS